MMCPRRMMRLRLRGLAMLIMVTDRMRRLVVPRLAHARLGAVTMKGLAHVRGLMVFVGDGAGWVVSGGLRSREDG